MSFNIHKYTIKTKLNAYSTFPKEKFFMRISSNLNQQMEHHDNINTVSIHSIFPWHGEKTNVVIGF